MLPRLPSSGHGIAKGAPLGALDRSGNDELCYVLQGTGNDPSVGCEEDF